MTTTLDYLVPFVRLRVGDLTEPYRYLDGWINSALVVAVQLSYRWLRNKYQITTDNLVSRNPYSTLFTTHESEVGVIEPQDEPIIVLLAVIVMLQGSLESSAWSTGSWKDAEISYSNIASGDLKQNNLKNLWDELKALVLSPTKRLATTSKQSLPGYKGNQYEREGDL